MKRKGINQYKSNKKDENNIQICCRNCEYEDTFCDYCFYDNPVKNFKPKQNLIKKG